MKAFVRRLAVALLGLTGAAASFAAQAQPDACHGAPSAERVIVSVDSIRNGRGFVVANVYGSDSERFLADSGRIAVWREPARPGSTDICFYAPTPGFYAVVVFHDANANGRLDLGFFDMPKEAYGFSNNFQPILHAPSLDQVKFRVGPGDTRLHIRLHYPP
jgi:uncharacterized protein (DUF2141 family)